MSSRRGFTVIEVMMVVVILGVIAALATVGMSGYMRHAKTAEATRALGNIEIGARTQFAKPTTIGEISVHKFCPSGDLTPSEVPKGQRVKVDSALWMTPTWKCLLFSINDPQFYAYKFTSNDESGGAAEYTAIAIGDLDGDGTLSNFELKAKGSINGEATRESFKITNEDE